MHQGMLRRITALPLALAFASVPLAAQVADPIIGRWVLNVGKSTFVGGRAAPKSESRTYVMVDEATSMTAKGVTEPRTYRRISQEIKATATVANADGTPATRQWTMVFDGKERPIAGDPEADTLSVRKIDPLTTAFAEKKAGAVVSAGTWTISSDGKVLTVTTTRLDASGQTVSDVRVFERQ